MNDLTEPFSRTRDEAHPVRWSPVDGETPAYLTLKGAAERLTRDESPKDRPVAMQATLTGLADGRQYRTAFAFYQIDEAS